MLEGGGRIMGDRLRQTERERKGVREGETTNKKKEERKSCNAAKSLSA